LEEENDDDEEEDAPMQPPPPPMRKASSSSGATKLQRVKNANEREGKKGRREGKKVGDLRRAEMNIMQTRIAKARLLSGLTCTGDCDNIL
jgi:hypothetical protein